MKQVVGVVVLGIFSSYFFPWRNSDEILLEPDVEGCYSWSALQPGAVARADVDMKAEGWAAKLRRKAKPVLIPSGAKNLPSRWQAVRKWNPNYISSRVPTLHNVYSSGTKSFDYLGTQTNLYPDAYSVSAVKRPHHQQLLNMPTEDFFDRCTADKPDKFVYYSSPLEQGEALHQDIDSPQFFKDFPSQESDANLWIGCANITATTHYDSQDNFYLQVYGRKRMLLFPPRDATHLQLYPFTSAQRRQSKLDLNCVSSRSTFDLLRSHTSPLVVVLEAGDLLYLPPYWFHHVTSLSTSVSLSFWNTAPAARQYERTQEVPLPFEAHWTAVQTQQTAVSFLALLAYIFVESTSVVVNNSSSSSTTTTTTSSSSSSSTDRVQFPCFPFEVSVQKLNTRAQEVVDSLQAIPEPGTRRMYFEFYFEEVLNYACNYQAACIPSLWRSIPTLCSSSSSLSRAQQEEQGKQEKDKSDAKTQAKAAPLASLAGMVTSLGTAKTVQGSDKSSSYLHEEAYSRASDALEVVQAVFRSRFGPQFH